MKIHVRFRGRRDMVEVTLMQMLNAREVRAERQKALLAHFGKPVISFSMNIPGPVKDSKLIRRGFRAGCQALDGSFEKELILHREVHPAVTGWEALYVLDVEPLGVKKITTAIEDTHGLGRLFDMDVIGPDHQKLDRETVGGGSRNCIVCGAPGRGCASRRTHTVKSLQSAVDQIFKKYFAEADIRLIGHLAVQSLLEEVSTTPKPGLVDLRNTGSHRDMDVNTFRRSACALSGYFRECVRIGMESACESPPDTFLLLRQAGVAAERAMYEATGGINTHKGAIFTLGILCGAAGRLWTGEAIWEPEKICDEVSSMTREAMEADWAAGGSTAGIRLYSQYGIRGIRGQVADGLPAVSEIGLPAFRSYLESGLSRNEAGVRTLIHLIARVEDTNMIHRGGLLGARDGAAQARRLLSQAFTMSDVEQMDDRFMEANLSPGGCADLLAAVYFVDTLTKTE